MSRPTGDYVTRLRQSGAARFTDAEDDRPHEVYRIYDAADHLLYVGCAVRALVRLARGGVK